MGQVCVCDEDGPQCSTPDIDRDNVTYLTMKVEKEAAAGAEVWIYSTVTACIKCDVLPAVSHMRRTK